MSPIIKLGRCGTTDDFMTLPFHLILYLAALVELACPILNIVYPLLLLSTSFFTFHCALQDCLCQKTLSYGYKHPSFCFLFLDKGQQFILFSNGCLDLSANTVVCDMILLRDVQQPLVAPHHKDLCSFFILCCQGP